MTQPVRNILRDLDNIRENLLAFSDDVWLNIDHNDTKAMKARISRYSCSRPRRRGWSRLSS